jgi:pimeloyl-ACP methyl ester carboxylesterase
MRAPDSASWEDRIATPKGRILVRCWGAGRLAAAQRAPIVLFHDSLGCVELWREFPARLAQATGHPVVAYDRMGFGRSDPHTGQLAPDFVSAEAQGAFAALHAHLGLGRFIAFGHSVGGGMAIACAAAYPDLCAAVVTEAAQAFVEDRTLDGIRASQRAFAEPGRIDRLTRYHGGRAQWVLSAWVDTWLSPDFQTWSLDAVLPRLRCPLLAIHGDLDEYGSLLHPGRLTALAGGPARTAILSGCGHVPHREREGEVLQAVAGFLERLDA